MRKSQKLWELMAVLLFFSLAFAVRVYRFGSVPGGFNQDEAMAAYEAYALSMYGTDRFGMRWPVHFTAWGYSQMNVLLSYAMIPFIKILGLTVTAARLPMLLFSMLGLYALYAFARDVWGRSAAITVLAFASVCPWHIMQSRWALEANMFPHLLMLGAFWLHKGLSQKGYLYGSMMLYGLSMYAYGISFYTVPLLLAACCVYLLITRRVNPNQALAAFGVYMFIAWPVFVLMLINYFKWSSLQTPFITVPFFPDSVRINDLLLFSPDKAVQLKQNALAIGRVVFMQQDGLPWNMIHGYGALYRFSMPFVLIGLMALASRKPGAVVVLIWLVIALFSGLMANDINMNRINIIYYPLVLLTGLGLNRTPGIISSLVVRLADPLACHALKPASGRLTTVTAGLLAALYAFSFISFARVYHNEHDRTLSQVFYKDFYQCLEHAQREGFDTLYVTAYTQFPGSAYVSEILTLFGLRIDPAYYRDYDGYKNKYRYVSFIHEPIPSDNAQRLYILNSQEQAWFPPERFNITYYGAFAVASEKPEGW